MNNWFKGIKDRVWGRLQAESPLEIPAKIFLITAQITTPECWVSNSSQCSVRTDNLIHRLPIDGTKSVWVGCDILPFQPLDGFQKHGGGTCPVSIFIETEDSQAPSFRDRNVLRKTANPTNKSRSDVRLYGLDFLGSDFSTPAGRPADANVVFVHGLGGSAYGTWLHPDTKWFWPGALSLEPGFENVRLMTFGYNSDWQTFFGPSSRLGFHDFAVQLLDKLSLHFEEYGSVMRSLNCLLMFSGQRSLWLTAWGDSLLRRCDLNFSCTDLTGISYHHGTKVSL